MITDPISLVAFLMVLVGVIFWLSQRPRLQPLFDRVPAVLWCYFVPMLCTTFGVTPGASEVYSWTSTYLLLVALFLMMITVDLPGIVRLGPLALGVMVAGTFGIVLGGIVSYLLFRGFLPPDAWMGFAALSGSWIGGTANMVAIKEGIGAPDGIMAPIIVVDTVVGYGWMGLLLYFSTYEKKFDTWTRARPSIRAALEAQAQEATPERRPSSTGDLAVLGGLGFGAAVAARYLAGMLPPVGGDVTIISLSTWAILIVVTVGLLLSFTPLRKLESVGASSVGYYALYVLLATIGAQANLKDVVAFPAYILAGIVWILIHVVILTGIAYLLRAPLFLTATASMANVGGAASAPIVASVYHPRLAPVGLLLAIAGYILGIYAGFGCAWVLQWIAT